MNCSVQKANILSRRVPEGRTGNKKEKAEKMEVHSHCLPKRRTGNEKEKAEKMEVQSHCLPKSRTGNEKERAEKMEVHSHCLPKSRTGNAKHRILKIISLGGLGIMCMLSCFPVFLLAVGSVTSERELLVSLQGLFGEGGRVSLVLFPAFPTLKGFLNLLLDTPEFYVAFWNSVKLTVCILAGQILVSVPAAWGFSRWKGKLSGLLFYIYTILMLLPFQVTMLSNYAVIKRLGLLDTHAAVILPAVFSAFPVFLIYRYFLGIPEEIYEAFSLESSSKFLLFWHMGIPMAMPGIKAALLLGAMEYWNMIEQPLLFLKTPSLWPYSLCLPEINRGNVQYIFAFSLAVLAPMCLLVFWGRGEIQEGIGAMVQKG